MKRRRHPEDRRGKTASLSAAQKRFLLYAIVLESQQVQMYQRVAKKARKKNETHLAVGFETAMEVEARHLIQLRQAAKRLGVRSAIWSRIGHSFGRASGRLLSIFAPEVPLKTVVAIETKAADDYSNARKGLKDRALLDLYLVNQVDEEYHAAWAKSMLDHPEKMEK